MRALKLFRRANDRPTIKDRAAALKARLARLTRRNGDEADPSRRIMVAGSFAAALPLPALAAPAVLAGPHPDAELLAAGARYERALAAEQAAREAAEAAWEPMRAVLNAHPPETVVSDDDRFMILGGWCWPTEVGGRLRVIASNGMERGYVWTGEVLRNAIRLAVPRLGRGGQTPHHVRRWKALLPAVDAFDARVAEVEAVSDNRAKRLAHVAACEELQDAIWAVREFTPTTPEGLAFLIRISLFDHERGCRVSPNLLHGAANVVGLDLSKVAKPHLGSMG